MIKAITTKKNPGDLNRSPDPLYEEAEIGEVRWLLVQNTELMKSTAGF